MDLNQQKEIDVKNITEAVVENEAQIRRLDHADKAMQGDFTTQPLIGYCFDQFAEGLLLKPSTAENLVDLQAEFNAMNLGKPDTNDSEGEDDQMQNAS